MLVYKKTWLGFGWLMIGLVFYLSLMSSPPEIDVDFKYIDKLEHFLAYIILMGWFSQIYKSNKNRIAYFIFFVSMGVLIEVLQGLGKVRFFEYSDMLANTTGVIVAWIMTRGELKHLLLTFENKFLN